MNKLILLIASIFIVSCGENKPDTSKAQSYEVLQAKGYSTPPDKRGMEVVIYSKESDTFDKRAQTSIKAAIEGLKEKGLHEITIKMIASPSVKKPLNLVAFVQYTPTKENTWGDKKEYIWRVDASDHKISNGQIVEDGESYPLSSLSVKKYLRK